MYILVDWRMGWSKAKGFWDSSMGINTKESFPRMYSKEMVFTLQRMEMFTKVNSKMVHKMEKEDFFLLVEQSTKDNFSIISFMGMVDLLKENQSMKDSFKMVTNGDLGSYKRQTAIFILEDGVEMKCQGQVSILLAKDFTRVAFWTVSFMEKANWDIQMEMFILVILSSIKNRDMEFWHFKIRTFIRGNF